MKLIAKIVLVALALLLVSEFVPGVTVSGLYTAVIAAIILGILNAIVRPIFILLTLPITILTLGLFILVINAALFYFVASFVDGFQVAGFLSAMLGALVVSIISTIGNRFI
jgi:putative membrane protein